MSLPSRERGLKPTTRIYERRRSTVAPLAGAWIETGCTDGGDAADRVAPLAGAWIETSILLCTKDHQAPSLPSRERGLKPRLVAAP